MRYFIRLLTLVGCAVAVLATDPAQAARRLALSVGVDVYDNLPAIEQLKTAVNDARSMGAALRELGFEATVEENVPKLAFTRAWQKFLNRLEPGDTAALFFAGHGVEIKGINYLLPRDVPKVVPGEDKVLAGASIRFNDLMDDLRDQNVRVALFIVDACRDNPSRDGSGRSVGGVRELFRVEPPEGSFVMYSAGAGEQALDRLPGADLSPNSVYTRTLLPILKTPGLSLQDIATRVREEVVEVARSAGRKQSPAYYDQLVGKLVLKAGVAADAMPVVAPQPTPQSSDAERAWAVAKDSTSIPVLEAFRRHYGSANAFYDRLAEARIDELRKQQVAVATPPPPPPPKVVEPVVGVTPDAALTPGRTFRDCADCAEMVVVPAGSFMMGSPASEAGRGSDEGPQHRVTIARPFAVGKYEVTFAEWDACVAAGGCRHRPNDFGWGRGRRPVIDVSWNDITQEYLPWLSRKTGRTYRLLTEAEWEYAARGVTSASAPVKHYWWGDQASHEYANYGRGQCCEGLAQGRDQWVKTAPVGQFSANPFGLQDMHGNAWEWVEDCWNASYNGAPSDGSAWTTGDCGRRMLRGGSWSNVPQLLRSAGRYWIQRGTRHDDNGFRLARTL